MREEGIVILTIILGLILLAAYSIKRKYDENALYIQQGYHQVSGPSSTWVK